MIFFCNTEIYYLATISPTTVSPLYFLVRIIQKRECVDPLSLKLTHNLHFRPEWMPTRLLFGRICEINPHFCQKYLFFSKVVVLILFNQAVGQPFWGQILKTGDQGTNYHIIVNIKTMEIDSVVWAGRHLKERGTTSTSHNHLNRFNESCTKSFRFSDARIKKCYPSEDIKHLFYVSIWLLKFQIVGIRGSL